MRDWEKAKELLEKDGFVVKVTDMVAVEVADQPGGLADILDVLEKAGINVEFMYAFTEKRRQGRAGFPLRRPGRAIASCKKRASTRSRAWSCSRAWRSKPRRRRTDPSPRRPCRKGLCMKG